MTILNSKEHLLQILSLLLSETFCLALLHYSNQNFLFSPYFFFSLACLFEAAGLGSTDFSLL
jgi:hypothetical protein